MLLQQNRPTVDDTPGPFSLEDGEKQRKQFQVFCVHDLSPVIGDGCPVHHRAALVAGTSGDDHRPQAKGISCLLPTWLLLVAWNSWIRISRLQRRTAHCESVKLKTCTPVAVTGPTRSLRIERDYAFFVPVDCRSRHPGRGLDGPCGRTSRARGRWHSIARWFEMASLTALLPGHSRRRRSCPR